MIVVEKRTILSDDVQVLTLKVKESSFSVKVLIGPKDFEVLFTEYPFGGMVSYLPREFEVEIENFLYDELEKK